MFGGRVTVVALLNDCTDGTLELLTQWRPRFAEVSWHAVSLLAGFRHAGWARRLAWDAAADLLDTDDDLLLSTDADTNVAPDWIVRTVAHIDGGHDAVAGRALTLRGDREHLGTTARRRLDMIGRYYTALDYLRADAEASPHDPWPRHFYEGGASIALSRRLYRRIGGAPTPPVAEDRALFERIRQYGGRIRHALDVRVFTSCRTAGRAPGGMADAVARWIDQPEHASLHETYAVAAALAPDRATRRDQLSFATLPAAIAEAQRLIRLARRAKPPKVEPIRVVPIAADDGDRFAERDLEFGDGVVPAFGVIGFADPVHQQNVPAG
ncbi:hypothetical protein C8J47_3597 [Sphingomonas sp. PP-F2F-G114-C0414]|nr:hypothetical protein C8J47_3597 [Sphingomonas sp. PP-F2F-G114-C0414]